MGHETHLRSSKLRSRSRRWKPCRKRRHLHSFLRNRLTLLKLHTITSFAAKRYLAASLAAQRTWQAERIGVRGNVQFGWNAYNHHGEPRHLTVYRLLAWTFLCTPALCTLRWSPDVHCEHDDDNHGNNELSNLRLWIRSGVDGHAAASAREPRR